MGLTCYNVSPFTMSPRRKSMKKFQTMGELIAYMVGANAPNELQAVAKNDMQAVEEVNQSGATAFLIIAETKAEAKQVEKEYALSNFFSFLDVFPNIMPFTMSITISIRNNT